jgi:lytic murein transglycosylase
MMRQYEQILRAVERRFGVDRHVIAAIWGVETDYGREAGENYLPHALATLVCEGGRRTNFWRSELIAALKLIDDGDLELDELYGSWAGAFGQTQFLPSTYQRLAVDFDGDGRRDLVRSVADALGSTANYLRRSGWQPGDPWMIEVRVRAVMTGRRAAGTNPPCRAGQSVTSCVPTGRSYQPARKPASSFRPGRRGRAFSSSATSTRSIPTIRPTPTSPTASPASRRFARLRNYLKTPKLPYHCCQLT